MVSMRMALVIALCVSAALGTAEEPPKLEASVRALAASLRDHAPIPVQVRLTWRGKGLLEGRLLYRMHEQGHHAMTLTGPELVVQPGERTIDVLLPSYPAHRVHELLTLDVTLDSNQGRFDCGSAILGMDITGAFHGSGMYVTGGVIDDPVARDLASELDLVNILKREERQRLSMQIGCKFGAVPVDMLPRNTLAYCAWDVVVIGEAGFSRIEAADLRALMRWVEAGGVAVVVPPSELQPHQRDALTAMRAAPRAADDRAALGLRHYGAGRVVLVEGDPRAVDLGPARRFIWYVEHEKQFAAWASEEQWQRIDPSDVSLGVTRRSLNQLMPERVELVPLWMLITILVVFVALIGPVDWLVLGALRRRVWTWVAFPLVAVLVTWFTLALSESFLGSEDHDSALIVADIGPGGQVYRTDRSELYFRSSAASIDRVSKGGLVSTLTTGMTSDGDDLVSDGIAEYRGMAGQELAFTLRLRKWTPVMVREFRCDADGLDGLQLDWDAVRPRSDESLELLQQQLARGVDAAVVMRVERGSVTARIGDKSLLGERQRRSSGYRDYNAYGRQIDTSGSAIEVVATGLQAGPFSGGAPRPGDSLYVVAGEPSSNAVRIVGVVKRGKDFLVLRRDFFGVQ